MSSLFIAALAITAVTRQSAPDTSRVTLLVPDAVWDGVADHVERGWVVLVRGERIAWMGPASAVPLPPGAERITLPGTTLIPGLIEGHSHLFLHPYDEALWDAQVLQESFAYRMVAAVAHARATLEAGVT